MKVSPLRSPKPLEILFFSIFFLFFFQLISDFIESIYAFGLLSLGFPVEIVSILFLFTPLILLVLPRGLPARLLILLGELVLVSRVVEALLDTRWKMILSGFGLGCALLFLPALLWKWSSSFRLDSSLSLGSGLALGLSASILFRTLGSSLDISTHGTGMLIGWVFAILAGFILAKWIAQMKSAATPLTLATETKITPRNGRITGLCLGLTGVFVLAYFAFMSPTVISRWTDASYPLILAVFILALVACLYLLRSKSFCSRYLTPTVTTLWNLAFIMALILTILAHQIKFPTLQGAYPLAEAPVPFYGLAALYVMLALSPVILVDFILFARQLVREKPSARQLGGALGTAALFFLLMVFAQVFTTVYDYMPVVGPWFRDGFWLVFLVAGASVCLPLLLLSKSTFSDFQLQGAAYPSIVPAAAAVLGLLTIAGVLFVSAQLPSGRLVKSSLKILTYNVQQGYSADGQKNLDGQLAVLRQANPDVIGLEESDMARISGGNSDIVLYFADHLHLYSYYGPSTVTGTFGIALLSRYPIQNPQTFYMYSTGEQTAAIQAQIAAGGILYNIFVTHLGNDGPVIQLENILQRIGSLEHVVIMGDFNYAPATAQYRLMTGRLSDSWLLRWPGGAQDTDFDPSQRIDYIYVSPGTQIADSRYLSGPASDHPALITEIH